MNLIRNQKKTSPSRPKTLADIQTDALNNTIDKFIAQMKTSQETIIPNLTKTSEANIKIINELAQTLASNSTRTSDANTKIIDKLASLLYHHSIY